MTIITMIVDRCHVADSNVQVLRFFISRLKEQKETWRNINRLDRRMLISEIIQRHADNRKLYRDVMLGT